MVPNVFVQPSAGRHESGKWPWATRHGGQRVGVGKRLVRHISVDHTDESDWTCKRVDASVPGRVVHQQRRKRARFHSQSTFDGIRTVQHWLPRCADAMRTAPVSGQCFERPRWNRAFLVDMRPTPDGHSIGEADQSQSVPIQGPAGAWSTAIRDLRPRSSNTPRSPSGHPRSPAPGSRAPQPARDRAVGGRSRRPADRRGAAIRGRRR